MDDEESQFILAPRPSNQYLGNQRDKEHQRENADPNVMQGTRNLFAKVTSKRKVAEMLGMPESTLRKRLKQDSVPESLGRFKCIFKKEIELELVEHVRDLDEKFFGVTPKHIRRLAYKFADKNEIEHQFHKESKVAGKDWLRGFMKIPSLSLRQPTSTSIARAMGFNKPQIPQEDELTQNICINCVHHLTVTYSFKTLIETSYKTLLKNVNNLAECFDEPADFPMDYTDTMETSHDDYKYNIEIEKPIVKPIISEEKLNHNKPKAKRTRSKPSQLNIRKNMRKILYCVECKEKFQKVGLLYEHYSKNHKRKSLKGRECEYCGEKMENLRELVLHRKKHLRPYVCEQCWEGYYDIDELNSHMCRPKLTKEQKQKMKILMQCDQCGKSYPPGYIKIHMRTHGDDRPYHCQFCPKQFKVPACLNSHILWNHKRTRDHRCEVCNATFISSSAKCSHFRKYHLKEKKYVCKCGKRFFSKSELDRHNLSHTGAKNFHCHLCDKAYQTRYGLNVHLKAHSQVNTSILNL